MSECLAARLGTYLTARFEAMVELLERLVRAESPSQDHRAQARILELLSATLAERGFRPRVIRGKESGGMLVAMPVRRSRGRPHQVILGHCDTVWPIGTLASMPIRAQEGTFWGPGSYDMKAGLVQGVFAVEALNAVGPADLAVTPVFVINSDEEIGSSDSTTLIKRLARNADRCFVLEPSLGPEGHLKTARKGVGRFTILVRGKAAHAGLDPDKGASAILELSLAIQKLFALNDPHKGVTVNVGTIDGGLGPNVVAPESRAEVDVRVPTTEEAVRVERLIRGLEAETPGTRIEVQGSMRRPPMERTPGNRKLWQLAERSAEELGITIKEATAGGASDGNTTNLYAPTLDGLGAVGGGAHARNEHLLLERMVERSALLARLLSYAPLETALR